MYHHTEEADSRTLPDVEECPICEMQWRNDNRYPKIGGTAQERCPRASCEDHHNGYQTIKEPNMSQLPTVYEDSGVRVFHNCSGEIFVENKATNVTIRISPDHNALVVTAAENGIMTPWSINGLAAFVVQGRKK